MRTFYWLVFYFMAPAAWASLLMWFVLMEWFDVNFMEPNTAVRVFETVVIALGFAWTVAGSYVAARRLRDG